MLDIRINGCHSSIVGDEPRGRTTTLSMPNGWRYINRGGVIVREQMVVDITTEWKPMPCGALKQAGRGSDPGCAGCENRGF